MAVVTVPESAVYFWLEVETPEGGWLRIDDERIGGKYWATATATAEQIAHMAGGDAALTYRATFTKKNKRQKIGTSPPFQVAQATGDDDGDAAAAEEDPAAVPAQSLPPATGATRAAARQQTAQRVNGGNGSPYVQPKIPMAFSAPPNDPDLSRFVFLHQLVQQGHDRFLTLVMTMTQQATEAEHARSQHMIDSMRQHYSALASGQERLTAALLAAHKGSEAPIIMQQLASQAQQNAQALAQLGEKLQEFEDEDKDAAQSMALSENPNNVERVFAGVTSIIGTVASTPLGDAIADMLRSRGAPKEEQAAAPLVTAPPTDNDQDFDPQDGRTLDDFDDVQPPQ